MADFYIIPVFVPHKGCPHDCVFCNQKKITGLETDYKEHEVTAEFVQRTIETYLSSINQNEHSQKPHVELSFFGGSFTAIPLSYQNELLNVATEAKASGQIDAIRLSTRPDCINETILKNLLEHHVDIIELGVQSMVDEVLNASERGHSSEEVRSAARLIKQYGFHLGLQMMVGLPADTLASDIFTAQEILKLNPDFVRIYPTLVIRDTKLEQDYQNGHYIPLSLSEAVHVCKEVYSIFTLGNIQIIRLGLQPTDQINPGKDGDVVAGPFHSAFRELVEGALLNELLEFSVKRWFSAEHEITIEISPKDISRLYSDRKWYFKEMEKNLFDKRIVVRQNSAMDRMVLQLKSVDKTRILSLYDFLKWKAKEGFSVPI